MASEVHLNDVGTIFEFTIKDGSVVVDVSGATTQEIIFRSPSGVEKVKTSVFKTNGVDGIIQYPTIAADIDEEGRWQIQGHVVISTGDFRTDISEFVVHRNV